jgi:hypothetical protein
MERAWTFSLKMRANSFLDRRASAGSDPDFPTTAFSEPGFSRQSRPAQDIEQPLERTAPLPHPETGGWEKAKAGASAPLGSLQPGKGVQVWVTVQVGVKV